MVHVPPLSPAATAAGLAWIAALWMTPRYLRGRRDIRLSLYWRAVFLFALSLTFLVPAIYGAVDRCLSLPNLARWISDALLLTSAYLLDTFYCSLAHAADRLRWHRPWLLGALALTLCAMAFLLHRADLPSDPTALDAPQIQPAVVAYRLLFLLAFGVFLVRLIVRAAHYQRHESPPVMKAGMALIMAAGLWGLGYLGFTSAAVLIPIASPQAQLVWQGTQLCLLMAVLPLALSITAPGWGRRLGVPMLARHARVLITYRRLRPLWHRLTHAHPQVILPIAVTWPSALWRPRDMELLLHRCVIEILDARWLLLASCARFNPRQGLTPVVRMSPGEVRLVEGTRLAERGPAPSVSRYNIADWPRLMAASDDAASCSPRMARSDNGARPDRERIAQLARDEAKFLWLYFYSSKQDHSALQSALEVYRPATCGEAVRYLERVAAALKILVRHQRHAAL